MKKTWWILTAALAFMTTFPAYAAEKVEETVVVTANRIAQSLRTVPQSLTVIDSEVLDKNQYESLANLLQNYGFQIMSYGPNQSSSQVTIRGMSSNYSDPFDSNVLVLVNGAPIASTNLSMIPMDGIEQVEILKGPGAVQYGSSAMGGVINIIPKKGGEKFHLSAEAGGGTWNSYRALGSLSGKHSMIDFAGAVTWNTQGDNYTTGDGKEYYDTKAAGRLNYLLNLGLNFNEENRLGVLLLGASDQGLGLNSNLGTEQRLGDLDRTINQTNSSVDATYDGGYKDAGLSWKLRYFNAYNQFKTFYDDNDKERKTNNSIFVDQSGGQGQISWNWNFLTLTAGTEYTENKYLSRSSGKFQQEEGAGFGLMKLAFLDEMIVVTGGIRYDNYYTKSNAKSKDYNNTSLTAGLAFNPWDWLTLRGSIGESYKVPSGLYVLGYETASGWQVEANSSLEPERGVGWDAGFDIRYRGLKVGLTYFSTNYRDKITYESLPNWNGHYINAPGNIYYNGLEGSVSFDLGEFFEWDFALRPYFNFTKMFNYNDDDGNRVYNVRDFMGSFGLNFNYPEWGTDVDVRFNYLGYQKEMIYPDRGPSYNGRTGGNVVTDIFITQTIYDFEDAGKLSIKGEVRNLTNENYAYRYDYPMPGRSFYVGLRYDF